MDGQIRDTMRLEPGPYRAFIGTLFVFIFVCQLVLARPRRRAADGASGDRRRAGAAGLPRGDLVRRPRGRRPRLSAHLRLAQSDHDPAQLRREPDAHLLAARAPVRQCDERRLRDRHRAVAGGPAGADPADGARSADRRRAGLHLRDPGDGLHRRRHRRRRSPTPIPSSQRTSP